MQQQMVPGKPAEMEKALTAQPLSRQIDSGASTSSTGWQLLPHEESFKSKGNNAQCSEGNDPRANVISALTIFALVFMSIYAFFKLLKSILRSRAR
jgi:hypothetical protein